MALSKAEFKARVSARSFSRYGVTIPETWFDELINSGLLDAGERSENVGRRPIFEYGWRSYRRALQIARLRAAAHIDHDQICLALFVAGYDVKPSQVPSALLSVYRSTIGQAFGGVRSRYLRDANAREITSKNLEKLAAKMGELDPDLRAAGFGSASRLYLDLSRRGLHKPLDLAPLKATQIDLAVALVRGRLSWANFMHAVGYRLNGILHIPRDEPEERGGPTDYISKLIRSSGPADLLRARDFYRTNLLFAHNLATCMQFIGVRNLEPHHKLSPKLVRSLRHPRWTSILLVLGLIVNRQFKSGLNENEARDFFEEINRHGFSLKRLWHKVGIAELRNWAIWKKGHQSWRKSPE